MSLFSKLLPIEYKCVVLSENQGHKLVRIGKGAEGIIVKREGQEASQEKKRHSECVLQGAAHAAF